MLATNSLCSGHPSDVLGTCMRTVTIARAALHEHARAIGSGHCIHHQRLNPAAKLAPPHASIVLVHGAASCCTPYCARDTDDNCNWALLREQRVHREATAQLALPPLQPHNSTQRASKAPVREPLLCAHKQERAKSTCAMWMQ
jgi:hypothetical protein